LLPKTPKPRELIIKMQADIFIEELGGEEELLLMPEFDLEIPAPLIFDRQRSRFVEVWMQWQVSYFSKLSGKFELLPQFTVDSDGNLLITKS